MSGGVDSMALALLCSQIKERRSQLLRECHNDATSTRLLRDIDFRAFVIDHDVREGSNAEAQAVSRVLKERCDIKTQVLKIDWIAKGHQNPKNLPNFETMARIYRFRALGKACRQSYINTLLLAHHEDDLAETVMARLVGGHHGGGLVTLRPFAEIPECFGMHRVHESGGLDTAKATRRSVLIASPSPSQNTTPLQPLPSEFGGVKVVRPMLSFGKDRLVATCLKHNMKWFEDHTNMDPTLTKRNAIRHMFKSYALPAALSKPALLALSQKCRVEHNAQLDEAEAWLRQCSVKLDTRSGAVLVRFLDITNMKLQSIGSEVHLATLLLRRIIMLVTPRKLISLRSLIDTVARIFPERFWKEGPAPPTIFTVGGALFKQQPSSKPRKGSQKQKVEWLISREPYPSSVPQPRIRIAPLISYELKRQKRSNLVEYWSPWHMFDRRFWIRVEKPLRSTLIIRPFMKEDLKSIASTKPDLVAFKKRLKRVAKAEVIWTLPVIVKKNWAGVEEALVLPTLGIGRVDEVKWEVRYKKVDLDNMKA